MRFGINTIDDFDVYDKTILCRIDVNQPIDRETGSLKSTARIEACIPTIRELSDRGAKLVLMAHQGSDIEYKNFYTTKPHSIVLSTLLGKDVEFIEDVCGPAAINRIKALESGEILMLDNIRFLSEEQTLFEVKLNLSHEQQAQTLLVRKLAHLADLYVCDAFAAAHRDQPSLCGFEQVLPSAMGRLFEKEYCILSGLMEAPQHPCTFILGGAKISDAFLMMETVLKVGAADRILTGGLVGNILLASQDINIGKGSLDFIYRSNYGEYISRAKIIYETYQDKIILPVDLAFIRNNKRCETEIENIPDDILATDIGMGTTALYQKIIMESKTVFVNGPMGVFEQEETEIGTKGVWQALGDTRAYTVVGGGDSITATSKYDKTDQVSYICTGGGAMIRFLTGNELPVVKALRHASARR